jgi:hypothetical protein
MEVYVGCLGIVAQMQNPYKFFHFTLLLLPWINAAHLSVFITGVGIIGEIVVEPRATLCYQVIKSQIS